MAGLFGADICVRIFPSPSRDVAEIYTKIVTVKRPPAEYGVQVPVCYDVTRNEQHLDLNDST
jgi:hypothetical protein